MSKIDEGIEEMAKRVLEGDGNPGEVVIVAAWAFATARWLRKRAEREGGVTPESAR